MPDAVNIIVLAIPVFFLLIGVEIIIDKLQQTGYYRMNDTISNLNAGITEQVSGAFLKLFIVGFYILVYDRFRILDIPMNFITWVILFIGVDFFYYWFHRLAHEINFLWGGHVVHHSSEEYNLSVALRQGAFQKFGSFIFYLPLAFIGFNPIMFIVVSQIQTLYQFWIHTKAIHLLPTPIEFVFNTPSHHRVHHGRNPKYLDRNHGGTFIIWDRMFGTFQKEEEAVVYGITKPIETWNPIWIQAAFWRDFFKDLSKIKDWKNKWNYIFKPPGWYPIELGGEMIPFEVNVETERKFNTTIPPWLNIYIFIHFLIVLAATSFFLFMFDSLQPSMKYIFAAFVIVQITCIGGLLEFKKWALRFEFVRLYMFIFIYWYINQPTEIGTAQSLIYIVILLIPSLITVYFYRKLNQQIR